MASVVVLTTVTSVVTVVVKSGTVLEVIELTLVVVKVLDGCGSSTTTTVLVIV